MWEVSRAISLGRPSFWVQENEWQGQTRMDLLTFTLGPNHVAGLKSDWLCRYPAWSCSTCDWVSLRLLILSGAGYTILRWLFQPCSLAPGWLYLSFVLLWAFQWEGECPGSLNRARIFNSRMKAYFATLLSTDWFFDWMTEGWLVARIPHQLHGSNWVGKGRFEIEFQSKA